MLLLFTLHTALAGLVTLLVMNVKLPVVLQLILVKVLLLIFVVSTELAFEIIVIAPDAVTVCVIVLKSLLLILKEVVLLPVVVSTTIPSIAPVATALLIEIVLLLI